MGMLLCFGYPRSHGCHGALAVVGKTRKGRTLAKYRRFSIVSPMHGSSVPAPMGVDVDDCGLGQGVAGVGGRDG